jgi:hypothetical protein
MKALRKVGAPLLATVIFAQLPTYSQNNSNQYRRAVRPSIETNAYRSFGKGMVERPLESRLGAPVSSTWKRPVSSLSSSARPTYVSRASNRVEAPVAIKPSIETSAYKIFSKRAIEHPLETRLSAPATSTSYGTPAARTTRLATRKCKPGDVNWHNNFETACQASVLSGKPVLLFQMMGNLDDKFC